MYIHAHILYMYMCMYIYSICTMILHTHVHVYTGFMLGLHTVHVHFICMTVHVHQLQYESFISPKRCLSCKVVTETCCPQGSSIPPGMDVSLHMHMYMYMYYTPTMYTHATSSSHSSHTHTHTHTHTQFEKGWILKNNGTKKWKHTQLVHQGGHKPCQLEVPVKEVKPGETVEVIVQYAGVAAGEDIQIIER